MSSIPPQAPSCSKDLGHGGYGTDGSDHNPVKPRDVQGQDAFSFMSTDRHNFTEDPQEDVPPLFPASDDEEHPPGSSDEDDDADGGNRGQLKRRLAHTTKWLLWTSMATSPKNRETLSHVPPEIPTGHVLVGRVPAALTAAALVKTSMNAAAGHRLS